ncbi:nitrogenase iron-molybdenum cofactor biosynthesis protein NifN [Cupriavidus taiwanensis]|uniref:Nitrogenase iron-molybdenum cofactor biosynthesis protein NifN n=1 Tax=Cupriavidus taiwanensis TaxID=164546 RepID=A0A375JB51_9BURK|nr:nitrogenase iron-molybdenum cofactor biosynthesis protein NifN [Cupriavidus taiwanensis]SPS02109.1 nifN nitrogenase iron-molybdenum cofactor biosynthesis protein [Cupriavidus taiwanensis]
MAIVIQSEKACTVNPLKTSQPLGASFAAMGLDACMPVLHGSQGCTSFALVLLTRHFKEAIPLQTTAMDEIAAVLGGYDNVETALLNIRKREAPRIIVVCSTGLTETNGEDLDGHLRAIRKGNPELFNTEIVYVSTPDYVGAFEDGYSKAVVEIVMELVEPLPAIYRQISVLPGSHLSPRDVEELRVIVQSFGLDPIILPDISGSLDGHLDSEWRGVTQGGTTLEQIRAAGASSFTIGIGEQTRAGARALQEICGTPFEIFERLTGLEPNDRLLRLLAQLSGRAIPEKYRRQRNQLLDAMLDSHFYTGGIKVAIGADPDMLLSVGSLLHELGAELSVCVSTTPSPAHALLPASEVVLGDLEDMERAAGNCDVLITHSHGRQMAARLGKPLMRVGFPVFDRVGNAHRCQIGYRGTMDLIFEIANLMLERIQFRAPTDWPLSTINTHRAAETPVI